MQSITPAATLPTAGAAPAEAEQLLQAALREGQERHFARCRRRIPGFVARHMSLRGAMRRYYPPHPVEVARLALSVALTPIMSVVQLVLSLAGRGQHATWLAIKATVQRLSVPRAHAALAAAVQEDLFAASPGVRGRRVHEFQMCVVSAPSFAEYVRRLLEQERPGTAPAELDAAAATVISILQDGSGDATDPLTDRVRASIDAARIQADLECVVAGEAARSDVVNTVFTGVLAKLMLGHLKLGAYGIAMMAAPPLYFRWSNGREERIRRAIDGLLPDGPFSLSRAGWNFEWTQNPQSIALVIGLFLGLSVLFSVVGYLLAPVLAPLWSRTGLPAMSLRKTVEAARKQALGERARSTVSPEVFAAKIGDLAEVFWRSG